MSTIARETTGQVASHLVERIATAVGSDSVASAFERLRGASFDCLQYLYILDPAGRLSGVVPFTRLMAASGGARLAELMDAMHEGIAVDLDQEGALSWARHRRMSAPPVVDADGRLLGCLPPEALIEIGRTEHAEDISRLACILHHNNQGAAALETPP
ncbi:MAG: hypothetical protein FJX68_19490 [Alphaproteobacteria bacterium]|nr:hypothetical protein [Alphaproteobacteria bacterium]